MKHSWKIVALLAALFVAFQLFELWRGGLKWKGELSVDGLVTLLGGLLAFLAIMIQLEAERNAQSEEREGHRRAVASAILFEIDSFYMVELATIEKGLVRWDAENDPLPSSVFIRGNSFDIYRASSPILGSLSPKSVSAIVKFYTMAGTFEAFSRDYQRFMDLALHSADPRPYENCARDRLKTIRTLTSGLKELATTVTTSVARDCGLEELIAKRDAQTH